MTIRELFVEYLDARCMFPSQIEGVIQLATRPEEEGGVRIMSERLDTDISNYPPEMRDVLIFAIRQLALEWIDKNAPHAWYRELFIDKE